MPIYSNEDFTVISLRLTVWKVMIEIVTVVKFRVNYGGGNGAGCFEVEVWAYTAKFTEDLESAVI